MVLGFYPCMIRIFRDIPGFFMQIKILHMTFLYLNSENLYYSAVNNLFYNLTRKLLLG